MARCGLDLLNPTKRALLVGVMRRGRAVADDLAAEAFISPGAARHHLHGLESQGYLEHESDRLAGPREGRPAHLYRLTPLGKSLFPNGSNRFLSLLLHSIETSESEERARLLDTVTAAVMRMLPPVPDDATLAERVRALGRGFDTVGGMTDVEDTFNGRVRLILGHCPASEVSTRHPVTCDLELAIVRQAVAPAEVRVLERRVCGEGMCRYEFTPVPCH